MSNILFEIIHQVLGNLVRTYNFNKTYVEKYDQRLVILTAAAFEILWTENMFKYYSLYQLRFGRDIIIPIKYMVEKELIHQRKKA